MNPSRKKTVLVVGGIAQSLIRFRGQLLKRMVEAGHRVHAAAGERDVCAESALADLGVSFSALPLTRAGRNPVRDAHLFVKLIRLILHIRPDTVLLYTVKPVIYGGWAARICRVPTYYALITGLGYAFQRRQSKLSRLVCFLYRGALRGSRTVFFQNPDDRKFFWDEQLISSDQAVLVDGSGVDLDEFGQAPLSERPVFLMIARLLRDKGVQEYVTAAERVKSQHPDSRFLLVGGLDSSPNAVREEELRAWQRTCAVEFYGHVSDVRPLIRECSVFVLPSYYREGVPRTILEAMAMGRPIITTDTPGCRETVPLTGNGRQLKLTREFVLEGENGFLVLPRDVSALESAMKAFVQRPGQVTLMGRRSREIAEAVYDVHKVNRTMLLAMAL